MAFTRSVHNRATGVTAVGGNNSYVGMLSDGIFGDLIQAPALPVLGGSVLDLQVNKNADGGWLVEGGANNVFRAPADMSAWTDITPPAANTREMVFEWRGRLFVGGLSDTLPSRNLEISDDNGATWDSNPGAFTEFAFPVEGLYSNPGEDVLLAIAEGGTDAAFTTTTGADTGTWTLIPTGQIGVPMNDAAISDDGQKAVLVSNNGSITVTADRFATSNDIPLDDNPFRKADSGLAIQNVVYVADLGGFLLFSNTFRPAFIDEDNMQTVFMGQHLGVVVTMALRCGTSDGEQALFAGGTDTCACSLRGIGQTAKV